MQRRSHDACAGDVEEHVRKVSHAEISLSGFGSHRWQQRHHRTTLGTKARRACQQRHTAVVAGFIDHRTRAIQRHDVDELRVNLWAVQALHVVVEDDLPVGVHFGDGASADAKLAHVVMREWQQRRFGMHVEPLEQGGWILAEVHEDEPLPDLDCD